MRSVRPKQWLISPPGPTFVRMQAHSLVRSLQTRRTATLAAVYDAYAKPLYGYCCLLLYDRTAAEAALRDTFLVAELRIDELRDPGMLKPWLFAIARGEATRRWTAGEVRGHPERRARGNAQNPRDQNPGDQEFRDQNNVAPRSMAETALAVLEPAEREALELEERYALGEAGVGVVLDLTMRQAHGLLTSAHHHLHQALTAVILIRTGREHCRRLARLTKADTPLDAARCRRVNRHAAVCGKCGRRGSHRASAGKVLTLLPPVEVPIGMRWQILSSFSDPALIGYRLHVARRVGVLDPAGFPQRGGRRRRTGLLRAAAAAAACLLVVAATVLTAPRVLPGDVARDVGVSAPDGGVWPAWPGLPPPTGVAVPTRRPSPSPIPLVAGPVVGPSFLVARSVPIPPTAAADRGQAHARRSGTSPAFSTGGGRFDDRGGAPASPCDSSRGSRTPPCGSSGQSPSGSPSGTPSASPSGKPSDSPSGRPSESPSGPPNGSPSGPPSERHARSSSGSPGRGTSAAPARGGEDRPASTPASSGGSAPAAPGARDSSAGR